MDDAQKIADLEHTVRQQMYHTEALDRNWAVLNNINVNAFRLALEMPDATIPDMVFEIRRIRQLLRQLEELYRDDLE